MSQSALHLPLTTKPRATNRIESGWDESEAKADTGRRAGERTVANRTRNMQRRLHTCKSWTLRWVTQFSAQGYVLMADEARAQGRPQASRSGKTCESESNSRLRIQFDRVRSVGS